MAFSAEFPGEFPVGFPGEFPPPLPSQARNGEVQLELEHCWELFLEFGPNSEQFPEFSGFCFEDMILLEFDEEFLSCDDFFSDINSSV